MRIVIEKQKRTKTEFLLLLLLLHRLLTVLHTHRESLFSVKN